MADTPEVPEPKEDADIGEAFGTPISEQVAGIDEKVAAAGEAIADVKDALSALSLAVAELVSASRADALKELAEKLTGGE